jgi:hypothetical protein
MLFCNCGHNTHTTDNCRWLGQPKCNKCSWFGHIGADCHCQTSKRKNGDNGGRGGGPPPKRAKREEVNHVTEKGNSDDELDKLTESEKGPNEITFSTICTVLIRPSVWLM